MKYQQDSAVLEEGPRAPQAHVTRAGNKISLSLDLMSAPQEAEATREYKLAVIY